MIPHRIKLSGFLSYKDEQDVRFDGASVWMLAGTNGSGKSSVFDAVTYALFGHHRGGSQNAAELINKDSTSLVVEFDFRVEGQLFRIKRTLRRGNKGTISGTQQVFVSQSDGIWEAVPDTNKKVDFDKWIHEKIGLDYDTFTSSVLLLQGKAEKLLDSKPSGRAEVLAGIVDLERYQRLHEKANARKLELKSKLDTLNAQAEGVPDVSDLEFASAIVKIEECEEARATAQKAIDDAQELERQAGRWADAEARLAAAKQKLAQAEAILGEAVKIERDHARLSELQAVLPAVSAVVTVRGQMNESMRRVDQLAKEKDDATERKRKAEAALDHAKRQRTQQAKQLCENETMCEEASKRLRELAVLLNTVRMVESEETKQKQLREELKALPQDPEADVSAAKAEEAKLLALDRVLPILERVQTERHELTQAIRKETESKKQRDQIAQAGKDAKAEEEMRKMELRLARDAKMKADGEAAVAKMLAEQATAAVAEFNTLSGAKSCKACGQPLTPTHFKEEKAKREDELKKAEQQLKKSQAEAKSAAERERELSEQEAAAAKRVFELRETYKDHDAAWRQATADIKRLTDSLDLRYAEMPEPFRTRIAADPPDDWTATSYPERDELTTLRREASGLDAARRKVRDAESVLMKWNNFKTLLDASNQNLSRLKASLPSDDVVALRQEYASLQASETSLTNDIKGLKQAIETSDREIDKHSREAHTADTTLISVVGKTKSEDEKQAIHRENLERSLRQLPDDWRAKAEKGGLTDYSNWKAEQDELLAKGVEQKFKTLEQVRGGLSALRDNIAKHEAEVAAYPPEVRRPTDVVKAAMALAKKQYEERDKEWREAQRHRDKLDSYREQRDKLSEQTKEIDGRHTKYKILSELLGRDRLQRHLVRQAERQIVDYANAVLDRLSGGQLYLKLVGMDDGAADKALDLECYNRITGEAPINVTFLSGSQRFRVAVSLALAIGQYASRQHRPIESVIIDEGFGCLDRQGRQVMIQELQNLRGHLHCILLVSHQEEFADAFADGYRFELQDGATKVSRFQR
jgi:exonuclease SbcC